MKQLLVIVFSLVTTIMWSQEATVHVFGFTNSTCEQIDESYQLRTRIISKSFSNGILTVQIGDMATCCATFLPRATLNNGVLNLDFEETGTLCECGCCYEFLYQIKGADDQVKITFRNKEIELSEEKFKTFPVSYKMFKGDTINYTDKYGLRQGVWASPKDSLMIKEYFEYEDYIVKRRVRLYPNGKIKDEISRERFVVYFDDKPANEFWDYNKLIVYYESGQKKKECYNGKRDHYNSYDKGACKEWNEKGDLIYEGVYRK
ncbi:MAG: hypothetical protein HYZ44_04695 [Bacteroidetes bacterium]|nr:hypothetical protein [Bacteroidota bacterium]